MKQESIKIDLDLVAEVEKRDLYDELLRRNRTREEAILLLLDIDAELAKEIAQVGQDKFKVELEPFPCAAPFVVPALSPQCWRRNAIRS